MTCYTILHSLDKNEFEKKVAKFVAKAVGEEDCGCGERQDTLNKRFPFKDRKK